MKKLFGFLTIAFVAIGFSVSAFALDANDRQEIESIISDYIRNNPEEIIKILQDNAKKQAEEAAAKQNERIAELPEGVDYPLTPIAGNKNGDITVVEFFDYNCGYCKRVLPDITRLIDSDANVKFVFKELPILSPASEVAARYAIASNKQGKYIEMHNALMEHSGRLDEAKVKDLAKGLGLDMKQLETDAQSQDVTDALSHNMQLAQELGVRGTPFFLVGKRKIPGAVGFTRLQSVVNQERQESDS